MYFTLHIVKKINQSLIVQNSWLGHLKKILFLLLLFNRSSSST